MVGGLTGIPLYFRYRHGTIPRHGEFDEALLRLLLQKFWTEMTRKPGKPQYHKVRQWRLLDSVTAGGRCLGVDQLLVGGCELYRLMPVICRPRG